MPGTWRVVHPRLIDDNEICLVRFLSILLTRSWREPSGTLYIGHRVISRRLHRVHGPLASSDLFPGTSRGCLAAAIHGPSGGNDSARRNALETGECPLVLPCRRATMSNDVKRREQIPFTSKLEEASRFAGKNLVLHSWDFLLRFTLLFYSVISSDLGFLVSICSLFTFR